MSAGNEVESLWSQIGIGVAVYEIPGQGEGFFPFLHLMSCEYPTIMGFFPDLIKICPVQGNVLKNQPSLVELCIQ